MLSLIAAAVVALTPPDLMSTSSLGLHNEQGTLATIWQVEGQIMSSSGNVVSQHWVSYDFIFWYEGCCGLPCPIEECVSVWIVYGSHDQVYTTGLAKGPMLDFIVTDEFGHSEQGRWAGPADCNLDGAINSTDYFDFSGMFFAGDADFNLDGVTDTNDYFQFLDEFFAS
jgi:hypothetical protein